MRFAFILVERANHGIVILCRVLEVSRSGFYSWRGRCVSATAKANARLTVEIVAVHKQSRSTYGSPRVHAELVANGAPVFPGSQFWLAYLGEMAIVAVSSCGTVARASLVDILVPRIAAGERIDRQAIAGLGHGGLIREDWPSRFPRWAMPRRSAGADASPD